MRDMRHMLAAIGCICVAVLVCTCVLLVPGVSYAEPEDEMSQSQDAALDSPGISALTDRYDSLDKLATSLNPDESVVVETRIGVLASVNRALENTTVRFSGEAIGEALAADDGYKWVNVADASDTAVGVYMTEEQASQIRTYGDYHHVGATLLVTGTYHIACGQHQGELDVHASDVQVLDHGSWLIYSIDAGELGLGLLLCALGLIFVLVFVVLRQRADRRSGR